MTDESVLITIAFCIRDFATLGTGPAGVARVAEEYTLVVQGRKVDECVTEITIGPSFSQFIEMQIF